MKKIHALTIKIAISSFYLILHLIMIYFQCSSKNLHMTKLHNIIGLRNNRILRDVSAYNKTTNKRTRCIIITSPLPLNKNVYITLQ